MSILYATCYMSKGRYTCKSVNNIAPIYISELLKVYTPSLVNPELFALKVYLLF